MAKLVFVLVFTLSLGSVSAINTFMRLKERSVNYTEGHNHEVKEVTRICQCKSLCNDSPDCNMVTVTTLDDYGYTCLLSNDNNPAGLIGMTNHLTYKKVRRDECKEPFKQIEGVGCIRVSENQYRVTKHCRFNILEHVYSPASLVMLENLKLYLSTLLGTSQDVKEELFLGAKYNGSHYVWKHGGYIHGPNPTDPGSIPAGSYPFGPLHPNVEEGNCISLKYDLPSNSYALATVDCNEKRYAICENLNEE